MGRGVSSGGGQSSLGYLFGSGEVPKPSRDNTKDVATESRASHKEPAPAPKPNAAAHPVDVSKQIPAGIQSSTMNNHSRAGGDNICNFITDRPSTKVQAAPGGGSSLGYLFGGGSK
ncbi:protein SPIRAL1-like 2 isoform X2 [Henckelia pumila]